MAAVSTETLSFDRHLRHAFSALSARLERGIPCLDGVIEMLRLRIEAEAQFAASLERIIKNDKLISSLSPTESLRKDGLDALHADMKNEYTQRLEFLNSLNEDVYQPVVAMRDEYAQKNRQFAGDTKAHIKALRQQQQTFQKVKGKYEKVAKEASNARTALINAKIDAKISSAQILKLGTKVNSTLKTQQSWKEKYEAQQLAWKRHQIRFDDAMTAVVQGMQENEYNRLATTKDSLNKWAVFITNLCANRNYDVKSLAQSMALIDADKDLQLFIATTLAAHPNASMGVPPHHSLHYGKEHHTALNSLSKTSMDRNHDAKVNTSKRASQATRQSMAAGKRYSTSLMSNSHHSATRSFNPQTNHGSHSPEKPTMAEQKHERGGSLSLSSFGASFTGSKVRRGSGSYSMSEENATKRNLRQASSPNSIGGFFKAKFKKQGSNSARQYNSQRAHEQEHSHTVSSFHAHESGVYPPVEDDIHTPQSQPVGMGRGSSAVLSYKQTTMSPALTSYSLDLAEPPSHTIGVLSTDQNGLHLQMNSKQYSQTPQPHSSHTASSSASAQSLPRYGAASKRKKLKKPSKKRIKQTQQQISNTKQTKSKQSNGHSQHSQHSQHRSHQVMHQQQVTMRSSSPKPPTKRMPQQIIIIKTRKGSRSPSPSNPNRTATATATQSAATATTSQSNSNGVAAEMAMSDDDGGMTSGGSTPILSEASGGEGTNSATSSVMPTPLSATQVIYEDHSNDHSDNEKPDTPAPSNAKKTKYDEHLDMAGSHASTNSNNTNHFSESEDEPDPLD